MSGSSTSTSTSTSTRARANGCFRIGVLSDTHIPEKAVSLPHALVRDFEGVDLILHAGDLTTPAVLEILRKIAPVEAIAGNNDPPELAGLLGRRKIVEAGGLKIGLVHGDRGRGKNTLDRAARAFAEGEVACVVFGHSHLPYLGPPVPVEGSPPAPAVLLFNPGSPTDRRHAPRKSYGFLEIEGGKLAARHVLL